MKVKNKLQLGFGFLFMIVLFFGAISIFYINQISNNAKVILKDNYESLSYCRDMRTILDEQTLPLKPATANYFDHFLTKEEANITERGEAEAVADLRTAFKKLQSTQAAPAEILQVAKKARQYLRTIETINMQAIVHKTDMANASVKESAIFLGLAGTFTFLLLFSFSVNFPGIILKPLNTLLTGIRAIGQRNYDQHIEFNKGDEFAEVAAAFNDMAIRLNEWENSNLSTIMSEKLRIETIIGQMHDAIIGISESDEVLFINTAAKNMLGLEGDQMEGRPIAGMIARNPLFKSIIEEGQADKPFKVLIDGRDMHFQLETREINVPNLNTNANEPLIIAKKSAGKVYILRNVTEFKERDDAKTNFIATISHELKTPIASIKMSLKLMRDERVGPMNNEQQQLLAHIKDDSDRLLKITSELLELSQVETGNIQLNFVPVYPEQIIDYAIRSVSFQAGQKGVELKVLKDDELPVVNADVEKTAWVLVNLLSNALRYSPENSKVIIQITSRNHEVEFSVRDFGKGIDEQYQKRLFDRYFQVPADDLNKSGSGLGLAISKDFIEAQNGRIWVQSAVGEGSVFGFALPVGG